MNENKVYIYRLTSDTGLAPCVEEGLLSLAVCKGGQLRKGAPCNTGLRHLIGESKEYDKKNIYIIGTIHDKFLYLARVTCVVTMAEYFSGISRDRTDDIYCVEQGLLCRNDNLRKQGVHTETDRILKDIAGQYVILSDDYIYLGRDAVSIDIVKKYNARFQETKTYTGKEADELVAACLKYRDNKKHIPHEPLNSKCGG